VGVITTAGCINRLLQLDNEWSYTSVATFRMNCRIQFVSVTAHSTYMWFMHSFQLIVMYLESRATQCVSETYMTTQKCLSAPSCLRQSQQRIASGWTVRGSSGDRNPVEVRLTAPVRPCPSVNPVSNTIRVISGGKAARVWRPSTRSGAEVKERVYLYLYSTSGPSRQKMWWTLTLRSEWKEMHSVQTV
jgi:hypothetical protein